MDLRTYLAGKPRGTATELANQISVSISFLSQIASGHVSVAPARAISIERATGGAVTRRDLRPDDYTDIWPEWAADQVEPPRSAA